MVALYKPNNWRCRAHLCKTHSPTTNKFNISPTRLFINWVNSEGSKLQIKDNQLCTITCKEDTVENKANVGDMFGGTSTDDGCTRCTKRVLEKPEGQIIGAIKTQSPLISMNEPDETIASAEGECIAN